VKRGWLAFIKHTLNHATMAAAKRGSRRFSLIRHVGRRSGKPYETVIMVAPHPRGFTAELTYGPEVAWYRNTVAANRAELLYAGETYEIDGVESLDATVGRASYPVPERYVLRLLRREQFILLHVAGRD
jgi:deazaflavin-dependent oxidoreductase (nitroreductase family)